MIPAPYSLLPFQFRRMPGEDGGYLIVSEGGEHAFVDDRSFYLAVSGELPPETAVYKDLVARHVLREGTDKSFLPIVASQVRSRYSSALEGAALHIVVVTLRCDHGCPYCQVSRQTDRCAGFDFPLELVSHIVDRIFESRSQTLTIEFQGGEPLLAFDRIRAMVDLVEQRNIDEGRRVRFVIASTLHHLTDDVLEFCRQHEVFLSTSLDGPKDLHDRNRPLPGRSSYEGTVTGIDRVRASLGPDRVSALTTLTRESLRRPTEIIDEYLARGFDSVFLRPLSPYGFAAKSHHKIGYEVGEYLSFYKDALAYIFELNRQGVYFEETYLRLLAHRVLSPFPSHYVDLSCLAAAGSAVLVYNYDGTIYLSDEARMLAEMGTRELTLGHVSEPMVSLPQSEVFGLIQDDMLNLSDAGCADCAYQAFCGADPVERHYLRRRTHETRVSGPFCRRHMGLFDYLFGLLRDPESAELAVILSWLHRRADDPPPRLGYARA